MGFLLPSSCFIVTSIVLFIQIVTPQAGALSITLNVSLHSITSSLITFIINDFDFSSAATLMVEESNL